MHTITISTGELFDRMSILCIKIKYITDDIKVKQCIKEYENIAIPITDDTLKYYYNLLLKINTNIWNLQSKLHKNMDTVNIDYNQILCENDRRFKLKQKINKYVNSELNEQKGYNRKRCVVYGHLGMGDMYWMCGGIRYLSTIYDEVVVICKQNNENNVKLMYQDDTTIKIVSIPNNIPLDTIRSEYINHDIYTCGVHLHRDCSKYPDSFYDDMNLKATYRTEYFYHPTPGQSVRLFSLISNPYMIVHDKKSSKQFDIIDNIDDMLVLNINRNMYHKNHKYYKIAQEFVNQPLSYYIDSLKHADELHLIESSLMCLAIHLDLSKVKVKKVYETSENIVSLGVFNT